MSEKYSLNDETFTFIQEFERNVEIGEVCTNKELVERFNGSIFNKKQFDSYIENAKSKAIWWALTRSGKWLKVKSGTYKKIFTPDTNRDEYIRFLSTNLFDVLMLKKEIKNAGLRSYHLSSKGVGDDLYFLTVSYYKQKGLYKGKHSISDFITAKAKDIIESGKSKSNKLKYEHMVPKNIYIKKLSEEALSGELNEDLIYDRIQKYYYICTVTTEEDKQLPQSKMSNEWDEENPFFRYEEAGISFFQNVKEYK
jgi:hypothetical protein